jgi:hypothetical protein
MVMAKNPFTCTPVSIGMGYTVTVKYPHITVTEKRNAIIRSRYYHWQKQQHQCQ